MAFCTPSDVRTIVQTDLTDEDIQALIDTNDAVIRKITGISSPSGDDALIFKDISMHLTAIQIKNRDPHAIAIGSYRETHYPIPVWQGRVQELLRLYKSSVVVATEYQTDHIKEEWDED